MKPGYFHPLAMVHYGQDLGVDRHAPGCWVNGGTGRDGFRGFRCRRCAIDPESRLEHLLGLIDRKSGWSAGPVSKKRGR